MNYKELRRKLRGEGFINHEIAVLHQQYLTARAIGIDDADIMFDRDYGMLIHQRAKAKLDAAVGRCMAIDAENDRTIEVPPKTGSVH
jgi:hypothetical protein